MSVSTIAERPVKKWRVIVFSVVAVLIALTFSGFFGGGLFLPSPWIDLQQPFQGYHPALHLWNSALWGMITVILLSGSVLALLGRGQKRALLAQFFVLAIVLLIVLSMAFDPSEPTTYLLGGIILALFILTYPAPRILMSFARERTWSLPLLVLSTLLLVALAPDFWHNLSLQLTDKTSEYAVHHDWIIAMLADLLLVVAGFLVSTRRPGWKALSVITVLALLYLGAAALTVPTSVGSWGIIGGILSILGGLGYIGAIVFEARNTGKVPQTTGAEVSNRDTATIRVKLGHLTERCINQCVGVGTTAGDHSN